MDDVLRFDVVTESSVIDADLNLSKLFRTKVPGHHILFYVLFYIILMTMKYFLQVYK